jgi:O-acetyl-ADP-ribose deacetylase (regulator of RNase III)
VILVVTGDLARQAVDAVIRPADASLAPVGDAAVGLDVQGGERFAAQRRTATPLEAGAAVVTGGGDLPAGFVLHVVIADERGPAGRDQIRRALVSAWQRAGDWGLRRLAAPPVGAAGGQLTVEEAVGLLVETLPRGAGDGEAELTIVVEADADRDVVGALVRRMT